MGTKEKKCYDGYLVKSMDPVVCLMPYIMPRRTDSEVMVTMEFDLSKVEAFIREQKKTIPDLTLFHFFFAAWVRACAVTPEVNRFITGNRIYQRRHVGISMMVKKHLTVEGKESSIFPTFETTDTLGEITEKIQAKVNEAFLALEAESNGFDKLIGVINALPPFLIRMVIWLVRTLDRYGHLPAFLRNLLPFHSGMFVTNVGSIGLPVLHHHLYEFGTTTVFASIGQKKTLHELNKDGQVVSKRVLPVSFVVDARVCDGFTYSTAFRTMRKCFDKPEWLLESYKKE